MITLTGLSLCASPEEGLGSPSAVYSALLEKPAVKKTKEGIHKAVQVAVYLLVLFNLYHKADYSK